MDSKKWYESKGVWGAVAAIVCGLAAAFGKDIGISEESLTELLVQAGVVIGGAVALYGRIKAEKAIK